jgi:acyl-CoA synthetase (AMP-forming)/AMP-acid ligase II
MRIVSLSSEDIGLKERIAHILELSPNAIAIEAGNEKIAWSELKAASKAVEALLTRIGIVDGAPVGWIAKNTPTAVVAFVALIMSDRMVVPLRPSFNETSLVEDIKTQRLQAVIGDTNDWKDEAALTAAGDVGSVAIELSGPPFSSHAIEGLAQVGSGPHRENAQDFILERLTSGTTGAPKRIPVSRDALLPSLRSSKSQSQVPPLPDSLQRSPALLFKPFSHAGGLFGLLSALHDARPIILFEKFNVAQWIKAVEIHRPKAASLVPAMIRMILEASPHPSSLSSLLAIRSGTAPLEPEIQIEFEAKYGIPILIDYGAAEFIGGLAGWTLADYKEFGVSKRGSVGRARGDVQLRVVDSKTFSVVSPGNIGLIEVKSDRYGPDWIRTNDLALIDEDDFIFLEGRADDAINRGGFKVLPEVVASVLRSHAHIADAIVIAQPDARLGQVPIAALEIAEGAPRPASDDLDALLRTRLPAYMVPVAYHWLDALPRTVSMKVDRPALSKILESKE